MFKAITAAVTLALPLSALSGCAGIIPRAATEPVAIAELRGADGEARGTAEIGRDGGGLLVTVKLTGMAPGRIHGAHLHTTGLCEAPGFTSAGVHLNPVGRQHGKDNPAGSHLGDLPNLTIGADGSGVFTARVPGDPDILLAQLLDADGAALVIHADADDYRTDPSGNSGTRIACGVLNRSSG